MVNAGFIDARVHDDPRVWLQEFAAGGKYDANKNNGTKGYRDQEGTRDKYFRYFVYEIVHEPMRPLSFYTINYQK